MNVVDIVLEVVRKTGPYAGLFFGSLALSLVLTPLVRSLARRMGMVDQPSARRINVAPVPRGGGLAVFAALVISCGVFFALTGHASITFGIREGTFWRVTLLSSALVATGLLDDKFSLSPRVKLALQVAVALATNLWLGIGFRSVFPLLPAWADAAFTTFWIVGAVNAFNLIDGLDGLASGLAAIAVAGMAGALFFIGMPSMTFFHFAALGALLGFLRYNFNPASVFLGDTGSMFLGYMVSVLPLVTRTGDSFLVAVGVPMLAMGVPIFDTSLAILRRLMRSALRRGETGGDAGGKLMQPDVDHLHHRLLRRFASQRKTAGALYLLAAFLVLTGLGAVALRDRAAGLFVVSFTVAVVVVVRDMSRVELLDAGRLLDSVAHDASPAMRRRRAALAVPLFVVGDVVLLGFAWAMARVAVGEQFTSLALHTYLPLTVAPVFLALVFAGTYGVAWGRAQISNYLRIAGALFAGTAASSSAAVLFGYAHGRTVAEPIVFVAFAFFFLASARLLRPILREFYYILSARRLADDPSVSRVLVYGAGLRYLAFRRELVRHVATERRFVVGLVDDDLLLKGQRVGGVTIFGPHVDAARIVALTKADSVVIACDLQPERLRAVAAAFKACGLKVSVFSFSEREV